MTPARSLAASAVVLGLAGTVAAPMPAVAAPTPCERAETYAAQSGAEALRIDHLKINSGADRPIVPEAPADDSEDGTGEDDATDRILDPEAGEIDPTTGDGADTVSEAIGIVGDVVLDPLDPTEVIPRDSGSIPAAVEKSVPDPPAMPSGGQGGGEIDAGVHDVGLGQARTAMIAPAAVNSAAVARILDGKAAGKAAWSKPVIQQAPPAHAEAATRKTAGGQAGPLKIGAADASAHAGWNAGMACGHTAGEAARAQSAVRGASILGGDLVRVPEKIAGSSTTGLERRGESAWSVASATVTAGQVELLGGKVLVRVLRAPSLAAEMSAAGGGAVRYRPALIEVSGDGIATKRLDAAGEKIDLTLTPDRHVTESGLLGTDLGGLTDGSILPVPHVPGLPEVTLPPAAGGPSPESSTAGTGYTRVHIGLGAVRKARKGHAIAARAAAITVSLERVGATRGRGDKGGYGQKPASVSLRLTIGLMEAAAVAPASLAVSPETAGEAGGLPITGPRLAGLAVGGAALLVSGVAMVLLGLRRRRLNQ